MAALKRTSALRSRLFASSTASFSQSPETTHLVPHPPWAQTPVFYSNNSTQRTLENTLNTCARVAATRARDTDLEARNPAPRSRSPDAHPTTRRRRRRSRAPPTRAPPGDARRRATNASRVIHSRRYPRSHRSSMRVRLRQTV